MRLPSCSAIVVVTVVPFTLLMAILTTGCNDGSGREQLTVVLEADRARAMEDQARLGEMQRALDDAKGELIDTRNDIGALRTRLLKTGALTAEEGKHLEEREQRLAKAEQALPAAATATTLVPAGAARSTSAGPAGTAVTRAEMEELLRALEDRLAQRTPTTSAASAAAASEAPPEVAALLTTAAKLRAERGLRPEDVQNGQQLQRRVSEALKTHRNDDAVDSAKKLVDATSTTVVDSAFIKKKYDRANAEYGRLSDAKKAELKEQLRKAVAARGAGNLSLANESLNAALDLL